MHLAQLEKEIEELSWKVERAETTDRGDLESQMHIAELKRRTLLQDFFAWSQIIITGVQFFEDFYHVNFINL